MKRTLILLFTLGTIAFSSSAFVDAPVEDIIDVGDGGTRYTVFPCRNIYTGQEGAGCLMPLSSGECTRQTGCYYR